MRDGTEKDSSTLADLAAAGDPAALAELIERHLPGLRAFVRLRAGPVVRAREGESDIVQSACREVLQHADRFQHRGEAGFKRWLYTTALRKILNKDEFHRAERRDVGREHKPVEDDEGRLLDTYASFTTPSRVAAAREELERIERVFDELPEEYREVIVLARIVGLSRAEIGEQMGRSEGAVRNLLHRALARAAELLHVEPASD